MIEKYSMPIKMYQDGDLVTIATAAELEVLTGKARSTIRHYAADKKPFRNGILFVYPDEYYERKAKEAEEKEAQKPKKRMIPMPHIPTLHEMAMEAKNRHVSYGQVQTEDYLRRRRPIRVPAGYTSMRDRGR